MPLTPEAVKKIAYLARLNLSEKDIALFGPQLSSILDFIEQMNQTETDNIEALAHPLDIAQRFRKDTITEENKREKYLQIAPQTEAGLYLVPKVIEEA